MELRRFDTRALDPRDRFDAFHQAVARDIMAMAATCPTRPARFDARIVSLVIGDRSVSMIDAPVHRAERTPRLIRQTDPEVWHVSCLIRGRRMLAAGDAVRPVGPGQVFVTRSDRPFSLDGERGRFTGVKLALPLAELPAGAMARIADDAGLVHLSRAPLLCETLGALAGALGAEDRARVSFLASVAVGILALAAREEDGGDRREPGGVRTGCERVRMEIDLALAEGRPEIARVAGRIGLTVRSLQRLLARAGTSFSRMVEDVRMERALGLLHGGGHRIQDVAEACGYADLSSFHRAFRRRFGRTPGATARQMPAACSDTPGRSAPS